MNNKKYVLAERILSKLILMSEKKTDLGRHRWLPGVMGVEYVDGVNMLSAIKNTIGEAVLEKGLFNMSRIIARKTTVYSQELNCLLENVNEYIKTKWRVEE